MNHDSVSHAPERAVVVRGGQDVADQREGARHADDAAWILRGGHGERGLRRPRGGHACARGQQGPQRIRRGGARVQGVEVEVVGTRTKR